MIELNRTPRQGRRNLESQALLGNIRIIAKSDRASHSQALLLWLEAQVQVVFGESECLAVKSQTRNTQTTKQTENTQELHADFCRR
jgi:hypothetical protein